MELLNQATSQQTMELLQQPQECMGSTQLPEGPMGPLLGMGPTKHLRRTKVLPLAHE